MRVRIPIDRDEDEPGPCCISRPGSRAVVVAFAAAAVLGFVAVMLLRRRQRAERGPFGVVSIPVK